MTGDRQETAINIGMSCRLISESMNLVSSIYALIVYPFAHVIFGWCKVIVNEENAHDTREFITKRLNAIKNQRNTGELEDLALIIGMSPFRALILSETDDSAI